MDIRLIPAYAHPQEVGILFSEYTDMLIAGDRTFADYLAIQHYDEELRHLEAKYGPPDGRLYLAYLEEAAPEGGQAGSGRVGPQRPGGEPARKLTGEPAGCIGLRKLDEERCEMKRLYVRPAFRGRGIGSRLIRRIVTDAEEIGYSCMLLDTLPFLDRALDMYKRFGFYEIPCYNDSPMETSIYMRLDLKRG